MILQEVITAGEKFANSFFDKLIGSPPGGDLGKFARTIYPVMAGQALLTQLPVRAFWFGAGVVVDKSGSVQVEQEFGTIEPYNLSNIEREQTGQSFWGFSCSSNADFDKPSDLLNKCLFVAFGPVPCGPRTGFSGNRSTFPEGTGCSGGGTGGAGDTGGGGTGGTGDTGFAGVGGSNNLLLIGLAALILVLFARGGRR